MQSLWQETRELMDRMEHELDVCRTSGCQLAVNERDYRVALRTEILRERQAGTPVTIVGDVCRGKEDIAELKCRRDCSEAVYKASQEAINVIKLRLRLDEAQMQREWTS